MLSLPRTFLVRSLYLSIGVMNLTILLCLSGGRGTTSPFKNNSPAFSNNIHQRLDQLITNNQLKKYHFTHEQSIREKIF